MHDLQIIKKLNEIAFAKVQGHVASVSFQAKLKELRDQKVERQLKRKRS